jgi:hypothetical protein
VLVDLHFIGTFMMAQKQGMKSDSITATYTNTSYVAAGIESLAWLAVAALSIMQARSSSSVTATKTTGSTPQTDKPRAGAKLD